MAINFKCNSSSAIRDSKIDSITSNNKNDNDGNSMHIFISYSSKDIQIAEKIERYLQQQREESEVTFSTWRDKRNIEADWSNEIANALTEQDIILLLWTKNASESDYVKSEWMTARALGKIIKPILFSKDFPLLQLPKPLENVQAIADFETTDDVEKNIQRLLYPLKILAKEKTPLTFNYDYNILPAKHHIPFLPNPDFVGRAAELVNLYLEVIGGLNKLNHAHVGIVGIGGVGKTQLAVEFTYRYAFQFDNGVYWIQGADQSKWLSQIVQIAQDLGLKVPEDEEINKEKNYFHAFYNYCKQYGSKILLIIDNVEDPRSLNNDTILIPSDSNNKPRVLELECNILFTTRRDFVLPGVRMFSINLLSPESSLTLLTKYHKHTVQYTHLEKEGDEEGHAKMICSSVGYLPLALVLIQAYLRKYQDISFKDYYYEFVKDKMGSIDLDEVSEYELATRHRAAIRATFEPEWKILEAQQGKPNEIERIQNAKKLVSILSMFPESAIVPKSRLIVYSGIDKYGKTKLIRPAESAFILLDELNLVDVLEIGKSVRIHPLLREYVFEKLEEGSERQRPITLKAESILNLKRAYYDNFPSLVQEYMERNNDIDSIREDFGTALSWSKELASATSTLTESRAENSDIRPIRELGKIVDQECHNLRPTVTNDYFTDNQDKQVLFAQAVLIRSIDLNYKEIANKSREFLFRLERPFLDIRWSRVKNKEALIRTLEGHSGSVYSVAITSDNSKIVTGSYDKTVKIWDLDTGELLNTLEGHSDGVTSLAITSDNSKIVTGSNDKTVKIWDLNTDKLLNTLEGHSDGVTSLAITSDNSKIVTGSGGLGKSDKTVKIWDLNTGELLNTLEGHSDVVFSVAITSDNSKIVTGSNDKTVKIWDLDTGELLNTLEGHSFAVTSLAITSDNSKIVTGSGGLGKSDKTVKIWDLNTDKLLNTLEGHSDVVNSVAITSDNSKIVTGSNDKTVKIWDLNTDKLLNTLESHSDGVTSLAITSDNSKIVSGSYDETVKIWDLDTDKLLNTLEGHSDVVNSVAITSDNSKIVSGSGGDKSVDNTIKVWDLDTGELLNTLEGHSAYVFSVAITSDNSKIVSGSYDETVKIWDLNTGELLNTLKFHSAGVNSVAITSDNSKIVSGSWDKTVRVWDLDTGELLIIFAGHSDGVTSLAITSDNSKIVSGSGNFETVDNTIKVWDIEQRRYCFSVKFDISILSIALSKSKNLIAIGGTNGNLYVGTLYA